MNKNDVIKALKYCVECNKLSISNQDKLYIKGQNPYCCADLEDLCLELIYRLQTENERISKLLKLEAEGANILNDVIAERDAEIERKDKILNSYALQCGTVKDQSKKIAEIKSEARKEFADKLKLNAKVYDEYDGEEEYFYMYVTVEDIDNLLSELDGKENSDEKPL